MDSKKNAEQALLRLARKKVESKIAAPLAKRAKTKLSNLGVPDEVLQGTALVGDAIINKKLNIPIGKDISIELKDDGKDKSILAKWTRKLK